MIRFTLKKILTLALAFVLALSLTPIQAQKPPEKANRKKTRWQRRSSGSGDHCCEEVEVRPGGDRNHAGSQHYV
jgi:hypothetical protein